MWIDEGPALCLTYVKVIDTSAAIEASKGLDRTEPAGLAKLLTAVAAVERGVTRAVEKKKDLQAPTLSMLDDYTREVLADFSYLATHLVSNELNALVSQLDEALDREDVSKKLCSWVRWQELRSHVPSRHKEVEDERAEQIKLTTLIRYVREGFDPLKMVNDRTFMAHAGLTHGVVEVKRCLG